MVRKTIRRSENPITFIGAAIAIVAFVTDVLLLLFSTFGAPPSPYMGIVAYLVLPIILVIGLVLIPIGILITGRRIRQGKISADVPAYPVIDLNSPRQRRSVVFFGIATLIIIAVLGGASYGAAEYMDSTSFCGQVCHTVMQPEYTAYQFSPHTRVNCVNCHIGPGAPGFVQAKLSGVRQLVAVTFNTYSKPIPVPVKELRPAAETCEQCHWPSKFTGDQTLSVVRYQSDEKNSPETLSLTMRTGGGSLIRGGARGIHWHADPDNVINYVATDEARQKIPWIQVTTPDGKTTTFTDKNNPLSQQDLAKLGQRRMDCIDCHNRPTHIYQTAEAAVDDVISNGVVNPTLPFVKREGVKAITADYKSETEAMSGIDRAITNFYNTSFPQIASANPDLVKGAVSGLQQAWSRNVFPQMNVTWGTYKTNLGHIDAPGCFRCHDGNHVSSDGTVVSQDCTLCHTTPTVTPGIVGGAAAGGGTAGGPTPPLQSTTPVAGGQATPTATAAASATPAASATATAAGANQPLTNITLPAGAPMSSFACQTCHTSGNTVQPVQDCRSCHSDVLAKGLHTASTHSKTACTTCHQQHTWLLSSRDTCLACHTDKADHNAPTLCNQCHSFTQ